jgi:hypothetical protein
MTWLVSRVEARSTTSTVTLRVVEGDVKESLECKTVKYGHESYGTRIGNDCADEDQELL